MQIRHVQTSDLCNALAAANLSFDGNIEFRRNEYMSHSRGAGNTYRVTLKVKSSRAPGHRMSPDFSRHIASACWHAHKAFMSALPTVAVVVSSDRQYHPGTTSMLLWSPGDAFVDWNIGSLMSPCMASEACECKMWAVVTPWLDHGREWYIRFVGTGEQCQDYQAEHYAPSDDYVSIVQLPESGIVYRVGHIIPR